MADNENIDDEAEDAVVENNEEVVENDAPDDAADESGEDSDSENSGEEGENTDAGEEKASAGAKPGRANEAIRGLKTERNRLREELAVAKAVADERARPVAANTDEAKRLREEKLGLMDPQERKDFLRDEQLQNMQQTVLLTQLQTQDAIDSNGYYITARSNPVYAKHSSEVEKRLGSERQQGRNWKREQILAQIIGERSLQTKPDKKKKEEAESRVNSARSKPVSGRSNTNSYRPGRSGESFDDLERRLENVQF